jgi:hypothetical protein
MSDFKVSGFHRTRPCSIHSQIEALIDRAGRAAKIIALCQTYYRLGSELWTSEGSISDPLLSIHFTAENNSELGKAIAAKVRLVFDLDKIIAAA